MHKFNVKSFEDALNLLGNKKRVKLKHNTYLELRSGDSIAVKLHWTDVVTYFRDGRITLSTGGWQTVTTKDRINAYSPAYVSQRKGVWYVTTGYPEFRYLVEFQDGMDLREIHPEGHVHNPGRINHNGNGVCIECGLAIAA